MVIFTGQQWFKCQYDQTRIKVPKNNYNNHEDEQTIKEDPAAKNSSPNVFAEPHMTMGTLQSKPQLRKQTIPRQTNRDVTPLSFGQQRMWFLQQLDPTSPVYNTYQTWRVRGALNVEALRKAFKTIVARHEVLRAVIQVIDGKACQVTNEEWTFQFPCIDLRECSLEAPEIVAKEITHQEAKTPFDLSRGPLFRAKLLRLDDEDHVLLMSMHHSPSIARFLPLEVRKTLLPLLRRLLRGIHKR